MGAAPYVPTIVLIGLIHREFVDSMSVAHKYVESNVGQEYLYRRGPIVHCSRRWRTISLYEESLAQGVQ